MKILSYLTMCESKAIQFLFQPEKYPGLVIRNPVDRIFLLWRNHTLEDYCSWPIFKSCHDYYLRRVIWEQRTLYKLSKPKTYGAEIKMPHHLLNAILKTFDQIQFKTFNNDKGMNIDGIVCGITTATDTMEWWNDSIQDPTLIQWHSNAISQWEQLL